MTEKKHLWRVSFEMVRAPTWAIPLSDNHCLWLTYFNYTLSKQQASPGPLLSQNNNRPYTAEPPFSDTESTQLDILKFVFMSVHYLSDVAFKNSAAASCCDAEGAVIFPLWRTQHCLKSGSSGRRRRGGGGKEEAVTTVWQAPCSFLPGLRNRKCCT